MQLWIGLPARAREAEPLLQVLRADAVAVRREPGVVARVYSGRSGAVEAPTKNHVPVTLVEFRLEPGARVEQALPASYGGFLYVVEGAVSVGDDAKLVRETEVGWLERTSYGGSTTLVIKAGANGARVVLYAGEPQGEPLVQRGPFVAESADGLARLARRYQAGRFTPLSELARAGLTASSQ